MYKIITYAITTGVNILAVGLFTMAAAMPAQTTIEHVPSKTYAQRLMDKHDCWSGEAPADVWMPGHVVVRYSDDIAARYAGPKAVHDALEFTFNDATNGVAVVYGFCR